MEQSQKKMSFLSNPSINKNKLLINNLGIKNNNENFVEYNDNDNDHEDIFIDNNDHRN